MATNAQILANRANAQLSTGPQTASGKRASSRNATKTGLYAAAEALRGKDRRQYQRVLDYLVAENGIPTVEIHRAIESVALFEFRLDRCCELENAFLAGRAKALRASGKLGARPTRNDIITAILQEDGEGPRVLDRLWRRETSLRKELAHAYWLLSERQSDWLQELAAAKENEANACAEFPPDEEEDEEEAEEEDGGPLFSTPQLEKTNPIRGAAIPMPPLHLDLKAPAAENIQKLFEHGRKVAENAQRVAENAQNKEVKSPADR